MTTETGRVEAFSDGVFAIAMTLLILEIKIPRGADHTLAHDLAMQWPSYLAFLVSFLFIGVMWVNHHRLFTHIRRANDGLLMYNLLLMLGVTVVPWPTAVLASHLRGADAKTAAYLFNGVFLAIAVFFNLFWRYAVRHNLIDEAYRHSAGDFTTICSRSVDVCFVRCDGVVEPVSEPAPECGVSRIFCPVAKSGARRQACVVVPGC